MHCRLSIRALVAAGALALVAGPALAQAMSAIAVAPLCPPIGPSPAMALPQRPPLPNGVTQAMVVECEPGPRRSSGDLPAGCHQPVVANYMAALAARRAKVQAFRGAVADWQVQADAYEQCIMQNFN